MLLFLLSFLILSMGTLGYDEKYDKIDVDKIITDDALMSAYLDCFLDKGPCSVQYAEEFKEIIPEVISTACEKCTDIQKQSLRKFIKALFEKKPKEALELKNKYDPDHAHEEKFKEFLQVQ